jgi:hypothetical protein
MWYLKVMNGDDLEQRAYACYTMGRTVIAVGKGDGKKPFTKRENFAKHQQKNR